MKRSMAALWATLALSNSYAAVDYSLADYSITPAIKRTSSQKVFLISYGHGEAYERNQNYQIQSAINKEINAVIAYRKEDIDRDFYERYKHILDQPRGAGYWLWKPYIILETLKMVADNDIVFYPDSGVYLAGSIQPLIDRVNSPNTDMVLFENDHTNRRYVKRDTYKIMDVNRKHRDSLQLEATFLVLKKCEHTCNFIKQWLEYCCIEEAITATPSKRREFKDFKDHRHDQAILSLLYYKHPEKISIVSRFKDPSIDEYLFVHKREMNLFL
jgi:hypothetical protein